MATIVPGGVTHTGTAPNIGVAGSLFFYFVTITNETAGKVTFKGGICDPLRAGYLEKKKASPLSGGEAFTA